MGSVAHTINEWESVVVWPLLVVFFIWWLRRSWPH